MFSIIAIYHCSFIRCKRLFLAQETLVYEMKKGILILASIIIIVTGIIVGAETYKSQHSPAHWEPVCFNIVKEFRSSICLNYRYECKVGKYYSGDNKTCDYRDAPWNQK